MSADHTKSLIHSSIEDHNFFTKHHQEIRTIFSGLKDKNLLIEILVIFNNCLGGLGNTIQEKLVCLKILHELVILKSGSFWCMFFKSELWKVTIVGQLTFEVGETSFEKKAARFFRGGIRDDGDRLLSVNYFKLLFGCLQEWDSMSEVDKRGRKTPFTILNSELCRKVESAGTNNNEIWDYLNGVPRENSSRLAKKNP